MKSFTEVFLVSLVSLRAVSEVYVHDLKSWNRFPDVLRRTQSTPYIGKEKIL